MTANGGTFQIRTGERVFQKIKNHRKVVFEIKTSLLTVGERVPYLEIEFEFKSMHQEFIS